MSNIPDFRTFVCPKLKMEYNIPKFRNTGMSQNKFGIFHDKWNIPEYDKIVCPRFKMEYSKNFKQKKYVPGGA